MAPVLRIVMYHYVRDLPRTRFPRIKGMLLSDFRAQVRELSGIFEMATLESALAFLEGSYHPRRDLCLLTFDDGLKEHYTDVLPILSENDLTGVFSVITGCIEEKRVADVHMNHVLMATMKFEEYRDAFLVEVLKSGEDSGAKDVVEPQVARRTYPWDTQEVAQFKYFYNFVLRPSLRETVVRRIFERTIGPEAEFADELYLSWEQVRLMQSAGMVIGGHSQRHCALSTLSSEDLLQDLRRCRALLAKRTLAQRQLPFCYPYGKLDSFNELTVQELQRLGFCCGLATESGPAEAGSHLFKIPRFDCKVVLGKPTAA